MYNCKLVRWSESVCIWLWNDIRPLPDTSWYMLSPWLYLVFVNDLLTSMTNSNYGLHVGNRALACPTQAYDIALMSTSKQGLEYQMNRCADLLLRWISNTIQTNVKSLYLIQRNGFSNLTPVHGCLKTTCRGNTRMETLGSSTKQNNQQLVNNW